MEQVKGTVGGRGRTSAREAMKQILRMIRRLRLAPGDRLPTQAEIRKSMGLSNFVIDDAMAALRGYGVICRSRAAGTVLESLERVPLEAYQAGVLSVSPAVREASPFGLSVFTYLIMEALKAGLGCGPFVARQGHADWRPYREADFSGLGDELARSAVDLVLTPQRLYGETEQAWEATGIPLVDMSHNNPTCGVVVDTLSMVADAVARLHALGYRRIGIVAMHPPKKDHDFFWRGYVRGCERLGLAVADDALISSDMLTGGEGGEVAARKWLALPPERRPDALVMMDDRIAAACERILIGAGGELPRMAVQCNIQAPMEFHGPILRYGLDIQQYARMAVAIGKQRLLRPDLPPEVRLLPLEWLNPNV